MLLVDMLCLAHEIPDRPRVTAGPCHRQRRQAAVRRDLDFDRSHTANLMLERRRWVPHCVTAGYLIYAQRRRVGENGLRLFAVRIIIALVRLRGGGCKGCARSKRGE